MEDSAIHATFCDRRTMGEPTKDYCAGGVVFGGWGGGLPGA
jgi:hypothetical protein